VNHPPIWHKVEQQGVLANFVGVGRTTLKKAEAIVEAAESNPHINYLFSSDLQFYFQSM